MAKTLKR